MKVVLLASLLFFRGMALATPSGPCGLSLQVMVSEQDSFHAVPGMVVWISGKEPVATDENGQAAFFGLCRGLHVLTTSHVGYDPVTMQVSMEASDTINLLLPPASINLEPVVIRAGNLRAPLVMDEIVGIGLFETRGLSLAQSLDRVSGVRTLATGHGIAKPVIGGLHSNRIVIVNQGVRLESQQWGADHAPEVDPFMAGRLQVVRGAATVRHGPQAIGGVVLIGAAPVDDSRRLHGELHLGAFSNNAMGVVSSRLEGMLIPAWNINWRVQATHKRGGAQRVPGNWVANTAMHEANWLVQAGQHGRRHTLTAMVSRFSAVTGLYPGAHTENLDDLNLAINSDMPLYQGSFSYHTDRPRQEVSHLTAKWELDLRWNNSHQTRLLLSHQENRRDEYDVRSHIAFPELSLEMGTTAANMAHKVFLPHDLVWESGLDASFQQNINHPSSARIFIRNYQSAQPAIYTILQWEKSPVWTHELGARYDYWWFESYYRQGGVLTRHERVFSHATASVGTVFRPRGNVGLTANMATAWRPPSPNELYANGLHQGVAGIETGNPAFDAEKSLNMNLMIDWTPGSNWGLRSSLGNNVIDHYIYLQPVLPPALTINGYYPRFEYRQTNARITTANLGLFLVPLARLRFDLEADMLWARDTHRNDWIVMMPADRYRLGLTWNPLPGSGAENAWLTLALEHTARQKRIPRKNENNIAADYAPPPRAYTLLHAEAGWTNPLSGITWGLSVYNATNVNYRDYLNRMRYFTPESGMNIALRVKIPLNRGDNG